MDIIKMESHDQFYWAIGCAILVCIVTIVFWRFRQRSRRARDILVVGLCDAGKSVLFSQLVYHRACQTVTSMRENVGEWTCRGKKKSLKIVDVPGHERMRHRIVEKFKSNTRAILFVIDSVNFQKEIKDVAEYLYTLLTDKMLAFQVRNILIACNKQDHYKSRGALLIQENLENELGLVRTTRAGALAETQDAGTTGMTLGDVTKPFKFSHHGRAKVEFVECTSTGDVDIASIQQWLELI